MMLYVPYRLSALYLAFISFPSFVFYTLGSTAKSNALGGVCMRALHGHGNTQRQLVVDYNYMYCDGV